MMRENWNENYIAIIGDIKDSRKLESRREIQDKLEAVLKTINFKYKGQIASKLTITLGDEFQGLLTDGATAASIVEEIKMEMAPVHIRFGIGNGKIFTNIDIERAIGADGPAYYCAREAINYLKENEKKKKTPVADVRFKFDRRGVLNQSVCVEETLLNTVFELIYTIEKEWSEKQRQAVWDMQKYGDVQQDAAERLNIVQSTLNRSLAKAHYYTYAKAMNDVKKVLGEIT